VSDTAHSTDTVCCLLLSVDICCSLKCNVAQFPEFNFPSSCLSHHLILFCRQIILSVNLAFLNKWVNIASVPFGNDWSLWIILLQSSSS
jgi:hypothetical protein